MTCVNDPCRQVSCPGLRWPTSFDEQFLGPSKPRAGICPRTNADFCVMPAQGCRTTLICASGSRSPAPRDQRGDRVDEHTVADRRAVDGCPVRRDRGGPLAVRRVGRGGGSNGGAGGGGVGGGGGRPRGGPP